MKFPVSWLVEFGFDDLKAQEVAEQLTRLGLEVDSVEPVAGDFSNVVVGHIIKAEPHPDADRLQVCQVEVGESEPAQIVCGAKNARADLKVAVAKVGAVLPGGFKIKKAKLRGVASNGMICSEKELGLADSSDGIMELPTDAPVGQDVRDYLELNDHSIEVDLTANRGDCLSVLGLARELGAYRHYVVKHKALSAARVAAQATDAISIDAPEACACYQLTEVTGVCGQQDSPLWLQERLRRSGLSSCNLIVDITNYVMWLVGQPMHAFDADKVQGAIRVRYAQAGETLILLDNKEVALHADDLVIADESGAIALAGIMGGASTAVTESTSRILLESAHFTPLAIAGKARRLGLHTDSSHRFERGVDPSLPEQAMAIAVAMLQELAGADVARSSLVQKDSVTLKTIHFDLQAVSKILGTTIASQQVEQCLSRLAFGVARISDTQCEVTVPSYRFDIEGSHDLVEEVARLVGYDHIEPRLPSRLAAHKSRSMLTVSEKQMKKTLIGQGYAEAITYSFIDPTWQAHCYPDKVSLQLSNALSQDLSVMRQGLLPGLLNAVRHNQARQQQRVRLFELGRCFSLVQDQVKESPVLAGVATGEVFDTQWQGNRRLTFFDVKNDLEALLALWRIENVQFQAEAPCAYMHPGQAASISIDGGVVGHIYQVHPSTLQFFEIRQPIFAFELYLNQMPSRQKGCLQALSKFPSVSRDLALVVDKSLSVQELVSVVKEKAGSRCKQVTVFDVYQGSELGEGKKSIALSVTLQDVEQTLTDNDVENAIDNVLSSLKDKWDVQLRS